MSHTPPAGAELLNDILAQAKRYGATSADAILLNSTDISVGRRLGELEEMERAESTGVGLRVLVGQRQATVSSSDLKAEALTQLIERAVAIAKQAPQDEYTGLAPQENLAKDWPALELEDASEPTPEWLLERCAEAEEAALAVNGISNSEGASAQFARHQMQLATSHGFMGGYGQTSVSLSLSVLAGEGTAMERDYDYAVTRHVAALPEAAAIGRKAASLAMKKLNPRRVSTCQVPVVFDPRVARQLLSSFTSAISGGAIARGTSFLKESLHKPVFSSAITIVDDPHIVRGLGSKPFDAEGLFAEPLQLVEAGMLNHWLLSCRSANQLGLPSNGRASRGLSSAPSPAATNLYIKAGKDTPQALMADIQSGFYVTETFGMGVNLITGDYSQGAAGFWIENGEIAYPVSEVTIAGTLQQMYQQLTPANDLEMRHRINSPTLRVEQMTVAGA